jgi:hypothetical protein
VTSDQEAVEALLRELAEAHQAWINSSPGDGQGRSAAIAALDAALRYFRQIGVGLNLQAPLQGLLAALCDAEEGRSNPLLVPNSHTPGTATKNEMESRHLASAAAAVTLLKDDAKWPLDKALGVAAKAVGVTKDQLKEFRKNIGKSRAGKSRAPRAAIDQYDFAMRTARSYPQLSAEERALRCLSVAKAWSQKG